MAETMPRQRGYVLWRGREATVWHAVPVGTAHALCGRPCTPQTRVVFNATLRHACVECVHLSASQNDDYNQGANDA